MADLILRFSPDTLGDSDLYTLDFTEWLATSAGDTITSATVSVTPAGMTLVGSAVISAGFVSQTLSGGIQGTDYTIAFHVATAHGRSATRLAMLFCGLRGPAAPESGSVASLGEQALRRLGVAIVPVAERPRLVASVPVADIGFRALVWLGVIAADETPATQDLDYAIGKVQVVHASLVAQGIVSWDSTQIPQAVSDDYVMLAVQHIAPAFGKTAGDAASQAALEQRIRKVVMIMRAPTEAFNTIMSTHADLIARGKARWTVWDIPLAAQDPYVYLAANSMAPLFGQKPNPADDAWANMTLARIIALPTSGERVRVEYF